MKTTFLLTATILVAFLLNAGASTSSARLVATSARATDPVAIRFSSAYTTLTKCGSGMTKKEEREAEKNGSDIPSRCKGYGGYDVYISYSACASMFTLEKGEERISLGMQAVNWKQKTVEWRLANGKPFAVIMRVYDYAGDDLCVSDGNYDWGQGLPELAAWQRAHHDAPLAVW